MRRASRILPATRKKGPGLARFLNSMGRLVTHPDPDRQRMGCADFCPKRDERGAGTNQSLVCQTWGRSEARLRSHSIPRDGLAVVPGTSDFLIGSNVPLGTQRSIAAYDLRH